MQAESWFCKKISDKFFINGKEFVPNLLFQDQEDMSDSKNKIPLRVQHLSAPHFHPSVLSQQAWDLL